MPRMDDRKTFVITGASTGIGAATARAADRAGYRVVLAARSQDKLDDLAASLTDAVAVRTDVTEWDDVQRLASEAGRADVVFANAGFGAARGFTASDVDHWKAMVLTNVYGAALTVRAFLPAVKEARGHFLLTGSVAGRRAIPGSLYSATKWAVTGMGESLRQELNGTGCRVTLIEPGQTDTPFFDNRPQSPLEAEDIANAVMYAISQPARVDVNELLIRPVAQDN
jgi:NADP-dependent 3-hydroxy acid dehydrogenase YdfG